MKGMHKYSCPLSTPATPLLISPSSRYDRWDQYRRSVPRISPHATNLPAVPPLCWPLVVLQSRGEQQLTQGCLGRRRSSIHADELGPSGGAPSLQKRWPREGPPSRRRSLSPSASDARDGEGDGSRLPRPRLGRRRIEEQASDLAGRRASPWLSTRSVSSSLLNSICAAAGFATRFVGIEWISGSICRCLGMVRRRGDAACGGVAAEERHHHHRRGRSDAGTPVRGGDEQVAREVKRKKRPSRGLPTHPYSKGSE
ncbi:hypothetical protein SETIT_3G044700v2 [Setaria italica]|uniref:Uncharacterized protein n=1 Tax=Setaria italica TaxID=4555 RepID=A0A368QBA1_SETIT|nr:hypothetical protein SETIT_3G044700v2 [Setaria italica]